MALQAKNRMLDYAHVLYELSKLTSTNIAEMFEARGFRFIGQGASAMVFYKKGEDVVKFYEKDVGYTKFLKMTLESANTHFPKLRAYTVFKKGPLKGWTMVKIEKLDRITADEYTDATGLHSYMFSKFFGATKDVRRWRVLTNNLHQDVIWDIVSAEFASGKYADKFYTYHYKQDKSKTLAQFLCCIPFLLKTAEAWKQENPEFARAFDLVYNSKTFSYGMDLHHGNIMKRGSTWVITDPYLKMQPGEDIERMTSRI